MPSDNTKRPAFCIAGGERGMSTAVQPRFAFIGGIGRSVLLWYPSLKNL